MNRERIPIPHTLKGWGNYGIVSISVILIYFGAAGPGLEMALGQKTALLIWFPSGFAMAFVLLFGCRYLPALALGAFFAEYLQESGMLFALISAFSMVIGVWPVVAFLKKSFLFDNAMERLRDVTGFLMGAALFSALISSGITAAFLCRWSSDAQLHFLSLWLARWLGQAIGMIVLGPFLLVWFSRTRINWSNRQALEVFCWLIALIIFGIIVFGNWAPTDTLRYPLELSFFPILTWGAIRFGQRGATTGILIIAIMAVWELRGVMESGNPPLLTQPPAFLWAFVGILSVTGLNLGAILTEHRKREEIVRNNEEHLRAFIKAMPDTAFVVSKEGRFLDVFASRESRFHGREEDLQGRSLDEVFPLKEAEILHQALLETLRTRQLQVIQYAWRLRGRESWFEGRLAPLLAEEEAENPRVVWMALDITERKRVQDALIQAKESADAANLAKGEFLAMMSHEIRTPMNAIIGFAELLMEGKMSREQSEYLRIINRSGKALLTIINNLLDFSKIESRGIELEEAPFNLENTIVEAMELVLIKAREKNIEFDYAIEDSSPGYFHGDAHRLGLIILNLVGNAVKFTHEGAIKVTAATHPLQDNRWRIDFVVRDTGIGIPAEKLNRLFQPFSQVDSSTTRCYGGTGLGLGISKRLIEKMGGEIHLESELGRGSSFIFNIIVKGAGNAWEEGPLRENGISADFSTRPILKVLLAEDDPVNQMVAMEFLRKIGLGADLAPDGEATLEMVRENDYDIILLDIQMPKVDGIEIIRRIRKGKCGTSKKNAYLIATTAFALGEDKNRFFSEGIDDYLAKPISIKQLQTALSRAQEIITSRRNPEICEISGRSRGRPARRSSDVMFLPVVDAFEEVNISHGERPRVLRNR